MQWTEYPIQTPALLSPRNGGKNHRLFALIEIVALDFKHVKSYRNKPQPNTTPINHALYGVGLNTHMLNDTGEVAALRNLVCMVQDAVKFIHDEAGQKG
jgi:hypothetical protein